MKAAMAVGYAVAALLIINDYPWWALFLLLIASSIVRIKTGDAP
jgi:hypothetical protein